MDIEQFRKAGHEAIDQLCDYFEAMPTMSVVSQVQPGFLLEALPTSPPEQGEDFTTITDDYKKLILPGITRWQHPSFFAFYPTACSFEGILGELYAASVANPGFNWLSSPACTELEMVVMDWCAKLLGLGEHFLNSSSVGGGVIQTTASEAALVMCVAARTRYTRAHPDAKLEELVIYTTTQTHSLGVKAGLVLGLTVRALEVRHEDDYALTGETLRAALEEDVAAGKRPYILLATVGTTSSGAIDRIDEIGAVLKNHPSIWLHVDAAWAGIAMACPEYREYTKLSAVNAHATSFNTNFHKWGLVNFDASMLWVNDRRDLIDALDITPEFLRTTHLAEGAVIDYRNWHLGLGRRFRSLKVWFVLRQYGVQGFQKHIREAIALNEHFASLVRAAPDFELVTPPSLALSVFRLVPGGAGASAQALDALNRAFYAGLAARSAELALTQTLLNGVFCVRFAVGAVRTERKHVEAAWEIIRATASVAIEGQAGKWE